MHWNHVNFVGEVEVEVSGLIPVVKAAVMMSCGACYEPCGPIDRKGHERCIPDPPPGRYTVETGDPIRLVSRQ